VTQRARHPLQKPRQQQKPRQLRKKDRERARRAPGALHARAQYLGATAGGRVLALRPRAPGQRTQAHRDGQHSATPTQLPRPSADRGALPDRAFPAQSRANGPCTHPQGGHPNTDHDFTAEHAASTGRGCAKWAPPRRATTASVPVASRPEPLTRGRQASLGFRARARRRDCCPRNEGRRFGFFVTHDVTNLVPLSLIFSRAIPVFLVRPDRL
jgi:hypothetical protein